MSQSTTLETVSLLKGNPNPTEPIDWHCEHLVNSSFLHCIRDYLRYRGNLREHVVAESAAGPSVQFARARPVREQARLSHVSITILMTHSYDTPKQA